MDTLAKMNRLALAGALAALTLAAPRSDACCPAPPGGKPVLNADQTVILVWDPATKTEHFIRRASWASAAPDFGFLVPTPTQPQLEESGDAAFPLLAKITAPEIERRSKPVDCSGCMRSKGEVASAQAPAVTVLEEKTVAGFHAVVLETKSSSALVDWLKEHGYAFSPEVEAWAKPYIDGGYKITALRVAKDANDSNRVAAASLRISFKTDAPLFPYREPDPSKAVAEMHPLPRLLRIYFLSDGRYDGSLVTKKWSGEVAWSGKVPADKHAELASALRVPELAPSLWLTEFEDLWPYAVAPSDLSFAKSAKQDTKKREPIIQYTQNDANGDVALAGFLLVPFAFWRRRRY
jgi:hypothetical protein